MPGQQSTIRQHPWVADRKPRATNEFEVCSRSIACEQLRGRLQRYIASLPSEHEKCAVDLARHRNWVTPHELQRTRGSAEGRRMDSYMAHDEGRQAILGRDGRGYAVSLMADLWNGETSADGAGRLVSDAKAACCDVIMRAIERHDLFGGANPLPAVMWYVGVLDELARIASVLHPPLEYPLPASDDAADLSHVREYLDGGSADAFAVYIPSEDELAAAGVA